MNDELYHHGILGQKWGQRNGPPYPLNPSARSSAEKKLASTDNTFAAYRESNKKIRVNSDGSKTVPKGFMFNRVSKNTTGVRTNKSGGLYVSYGKADASRYVEIYGPSFLNRITGVSKEAVQHISVKKDLRLASEDQTVQETGKFLKENPDVAKSLTKFWLVASHLSDKSLDIRKEDNLDRMINDPASIKSKQMAYTVSMISVLSDEYGKEIVRMYDHFRKNGYDAIPDLHDQMAGISETATIIINPDKVEVKETTILTKEVLNAGREYVKSLDKLSMSEVLKKL